MDWRARGAGRWRCVMEDGVCGAPVGHVRLWDTCGVRLRLGGSGQDRAPL